MINNSFDELEVNLYSKLYKEFNAGKKEELLTHIDSKFSFGEKFHYFVLINYKEKTIDSFKGTASKKKHVDILKDVINKKFENAEKSVLSDIKFKIFIINENEKDITKKINKEFCLIDNKLNPEKK